MQRIRELVASVKASYPSDHFFSDLDIVLKTNCLARTKFACYERALLTLDHDSWVILKDKSIKHYLNHRNGQLKQGFYNQLNEAFAYEYLVRSGCQCVRILNETGSRIPDISYNFQDTFGHCEVKTIGISEEEIARCNNGQSFSVDTYRNLSEGFLCKLDSDLTYADSQIAAKRTTGLIYVVIHFDDFTLKFYEEYRKQILSRIHQHNSPNIHIKIGLQGQRRISKGSLRNLLNRPPKD